eukprot:9094008-Pyramimonas_sp.AAC.1
MCPCITRSRGSNARSYLNLRTMKYLSIKTLCRLQCCSPDMHDFSMMSRAQHGQMIGHAMTITVTKAVLAQ